MRAWRYAPTRRAPVGTYLVAHGLHFQGPADPRMDRFLRVLAHAGFVVHAPFLPTLVSLVVSDAVNAELAAAARAVLDDDERPKTRPGVFSISFGSLPAFALAADDTLGRTLGGVVVFGGYADFARTLAFALGDRTVAPDAPAKDPLNQPVVLLNLLDEIDDDGADKGAVALAWRRYVSETWGRPELKARERYTAIANAIAAELDERTRALFLEGTGVLPGADARARRALLLRDTTTLDPRPFLGRVHCPIHAIHGKDDDVIPYVELDTFRAHIPSTKLAAAHLTGLYAHTGTGGVASLVRDLPAAVREARTMLAMLESIVHVGTRPT
jgi:hypothetical protein